MLLKTRKAKLSDRGVYLQDVILQQTVFKPGTHFKYIIEKGKIIILSSENSEDNTVSRRVLKNSVKPVIDIRHKEALSSFNGCDYLQVEIHNEHIIVQGYVDDSSDSTMSHKGKNETKCNVVKKNVIDITDLIQVRKKVEIVLSKQSIRKAAGSSKFEQLEFDLLFEESSISEASKTYLQPALENLEIPLEVASLFSGAGIMDLGFKEEGFDIVFALEYNKAAVSTYRHNIGTHITHADITRFNKSQITKAPIMIGGSPCQGFSRSNSYTNYLDNPNNLLIRSYIEAIQANENCKIFVIENVPRLLTAGEGKFKKEIDDALSDFEITSGVISAASMGSAQIRERCIIIGSKIGKIELPKPMFNQGDYRTVRQAFKGLHNGIKNQMDITKSKKETIEKMMFVPPGGNILNIPEEFRPKGQHSDIYKRLEYDKPSVTIVNPRKACILHPEEHRILSVRECARLFDVPDSFEFIGSLQEKQQQIANAVPVSLVRSIASKIKASIQNFNNNLMNFKGLRLC